MLFARKPAFWLVPLLAAGIASFSVIGGDSRWLVALGGVLLSGHWPDSVPYATAATSGWPNVPALAEVVLRLFWRAFGERGLVGAQVIAAAGAFTALAAGLRRETRSAPAVLVLSVFVMLASLAALLVVRNGLFSLLLFPILLLLLESESRSPTRRIWLVLPLLALWSNLHGGVLFGYALVAAYALVSRRRAAPGLLVGGALALCATPVLWRTPDYYLGVFRNEAARRGIGLWAPLGLGFFDLLLVVAVVALLAFALTPGRRSWRGWEAVAVVGLMFETLHTARAGTWLAFVLAYPAVAHAALVLVGRTGAAGRVAARDPRLVRVDRDAKAVLYRVVAP